VSSQRLFGLATPRVKARGTGGADGEVRTLPAPDRVRIPLTVPGQPALALAIAAGKRVKTGQALAVTPSGTAVHATVSGEVTRIGLMHAPDGREIQGIEILASDQQEWVKVHGIESLGEASWEELTSTLVGLGAASPWKPKAMQEVAESAELPPIHTVIIMASDREPDLTVQRSYLAPQRQDLIGSLKAVRTLAGGSARIVMLVPAALRDDVARDFGDIEVQAVSERYPASHWRLLVARAAGVRNITISKARAAGILVMSAEEAALAGRSLREGLPRTAKRVTVIGKGLAEPVIVETVLGAPIEHLLKQLEIDVTAGDRVLLGGRWLGHAQFDLAAPITRSTDGLTILPAADVVQSAENPCINCGRCTNACPVRIQVSLVARYAEFGHMAEAYALGAHACIECGLCAYVCPARRPLQQYVRFAVLKHEDREIREAQGDEETLDSKLPTAHDLPSAPRAESWTAER
jgi:electron transport complex protein RnfC